MINQLLRRMEESDQEGVRDLLRSEMTGGQAWAIHLSIFPFVQRVLNPPFINPHLPKMYRIQRELISYLQEDDIPSLVRLEINEYTRRPKSKELPKPAGRNTSVSFPQIETAIREGDRQEVAALMQTFQEQEGKSELARRLLLLGGGYLDTSLGHSVSCTGFILLEMLERSDQDSWPTLGGLADYFCKGQFNESTRMKNISSEEDLDRHLLRATSGFGIANLHHTITRYAIERVRHLLSETEYSHLIGCWIDFLGTKIEETPSLGTPAGGIVDYESFYRYFSEREEEAVLSFLAGMITSKEGRQRLGRYLTKGVCDGYQGSYDPHFLTGLGAALWVVELYCDRPHIAMNALRQYLNYYFTQRIY